MIKARETRRPTNQPVGLLTNLHLNNSLTLAVTTIPAKIAAACMLQLAVAFRADAYHVGHDGAGNGFLLGVKLGVLFADGACGIGKILDATDSDHDALRDRLLR